MQPKSLSARLRDHAERIRTAAARIDEAVIADALQAEHALIVEAAERIDALEAAVKPRSISLASWFRPRQRAAP